MHRREAMTKVLTSRRLAQDGRVHVPAQQDTRDEAAKNIHFRSNEELAERKASLHQSTKRLLGLDKTILDSGCIIASGRDLSVDVFAHVHDVTFNTIRRHNGAIILGEGALDCTSLRIPQHTQKLRPPRIPIQFHGVATENMRDRVN